MVIDFIELLKITLNSTVVFFFLLGFFKYSCDFLWFESTVSRRSNKDMQQKWYNSNCKACVHGQDLKSLNCYVLAQGNAGDAVLFVLSFMRFTKSYLCFLKCWGYNSVLPFHCQQIYEPQVKFLTCDFGLREFNIMRSHNINNFSV